MAQITEQNLEAIINDRTSIVNNFIHHGNEPTFGRITLFAGLIFYEPGWDYDVVKVVGGPPQFFVRSWDPRA